MSLNEFLHVSLFSSQRNIASYNEKSKYFSIELIYERALETHQQGNRKAPKDEFRLRQLRG